MRRVGERVVCVACMDGSLRPVLSPRAVVLRPGDVPVEPLGVPPLRGPRAPRGLLRAPAADPDRGRLARDLRWEGGVVTAAAAQRVRVVAWEEWQGKFLCLTNPLPCLYCPMLRQHLLQMTTPCLQLTARPPAWPASMHWQLHAAVCERAVLPALPPPCQRPA